MADYHEYTIDGEKYIQRRLALGQTAQLSELLAETYFPTDGNMLGIVAALGGKLSKALAIVLIPAGEPLATSDDIKYALQAKDIEALTKEFDYAVDTDMQSLALKVAEHFLECNHLSLLFDKIGEMMEKATEKTKTVREKNETG